MPPLALLLKSFQGDLAYAERLVTSFRTFNTDGLTLHIVVPETDVALFADLGGGDVVVRSEQPLAGYFVDEPVQGIRPGYVNQQIVKLAAWELGLAENLFCVDSDAVFIRPFGVTDFIAPDGAPYSVLVEDNELKVEPRYYREYWQGRQARIETIARTIGFDDPVLRTCHGHQVLSAAVTRSFVEGFLTPRGWSYRDALAVAPMEFTWYSLWLQKSGVVPIHAREPFVKVFHHEGQHLEYILRGIQTADIARGYLGLVINSNYSRDLGLIDPDASKPESLSRYLSYGEVAQLIGAKTKDTWRRRVGGRGRRTQGSSS